MGFQRWRFRWRFRRPQVGIRRRRRGGVWFLAFAILFGVLFQCLWILENSLEPMLFSIAKTKVKQLATEAVMDATKKQSAMGDDLNNIMKVKTDQNNRISFIQIDQKVQADIYHQTLKSFRDRLYHLKNEDVGITLGQALQSNILAGYGPEIPIEIWPKGDTNINLRPEMKSAGVNNVMITLMMDIDTEMSVVVPFTSEPIRVKTEIPLANAMVVGDVPKYYYYNGVDGSIQKREIDHGDKKSSGGAEPPPPMVPSERVE
ncbi:hypothetical protein GCM10011571_05570 [Marinithermofilum abyssi]|uniref:Sporulation protein YunB n=1 Tax=Marinithermofilum abyssi TaxID=1571185 RepID=A0A8J2YD50_9BACL|nr:sporulation protein YunB [Marinithermofilum abyssi]GGE07221.1 hypothetical protein GCM10011571_05570 [Marinithermofilum abyssi]